METLQVRSEADRKSGLPWLFVACGVLVLLSLALGFIPVPLALIKIVSIIVAVLFIAIPIFAIYRAADHPWTPKLAGIILAVGVAMHVGFALMSRGLFGGVGVFAGLSSALMQAGLILWTTGAGALLTTLLKDKNLLIPVSIFLAAYDIFLVLTPMGFTNQIMKSSPEVLHSVGLVIPKVVVQPTTGVVQPALYVGPADLLFMAMFFVALYRFNMRPRETMIALIPTLLLYMIIVIAFGIPLPALVPIGICVLAVNFREFKLNKEEWASTALITAIVTGLIIFGATRPKPKAGTSPEPLSSSAPGSQDLLPPGAPNSRR